MFEIRIHFGCHIRIRSLRDAVLCVTIVGMVIAIMFCDYYSYHQCQKKGKQFVFLVATENRKEEGCN